MKFLINKTAFALLLMGIVFTGEKLMAEPSDLKSVKVNLGTATESDFINFLYDYSKNNRLSLDWFGWYHSEKASEWYERADRNSNFKVNIHLLTEKNGYIYFSSGFDHNTVNLIIDLGSEKEEWLKIVEDFKRELKQKNYQVLS